MQDKAKRARGTGSIYRNGSAVWWIKFHDRGIPRRESSGSSDRAVAERLLKHRLAEVTVGKYTVPKNIRIDDLIADLISEYKEKQRKSLGHVETRWRLHLKPFFTRMRVSDLGTDQVRRYSTKRREKGASPATINRELSILKHAFYAAKKSDPPKVDAVPYFPMYEEHNTRKGFLKDEEHGRLAMECGKEGLWLRALLAVAYNFGWRKGELLGLRVRQIDLAASTIQLDVGTTKNGRGRLVPMTQDVLTLLTACIAGKKKDDYVFTHADGKPVKDFRKLWHTVCERAGVPDLLFHDLRRTGVRNLRRLGVAESVAMRISGHKTSAVFKRYDIIDEADLKDAVTRLDGKQNSRAPDFGQSLGMIAPKTGNPQTASSLAPLPN